MDGHIHPQLRSPLNMTEQMSLSSDFDSGEEPKSHPSIRFARASHVNFVHFCGYPNDPYRIFAIVGSTLCRGPPGNRVLAHGGMLEVSGAEGTVNLNSHPSSNHHVRTSESLDTKRASELRGLPRAFEAFSSNGSRRMLQLIMN